jgi:dihydroorotate dehydrogenase electron transfer subunit
VLRPPQAHRFTLQYEGETDLTGEDPPMPYYETPLVERREPDHHTLLSLYAPELANAVRPGQVVMVRCAPPASDDPLLRRALFVAGTTSATGQIELLVEPTERGLHWLASQPLGTKLDLYGPVGQGFSLNADTHNLLLAGTGPAFPALLFAARDAVARGLAVVLLASAESDQALPPPFLLPPEVEYQTSNTGTASLFHLIAGRTEAPPAKTSSKRKAARKPPEPIPTLGNSPLAWADQIFLALTEPLTTEAVQTIRTGRLRWPREFAQVALAGPIPCGLGTCYACPVTTHDGQRLRCKDGPVFDLRLLG